MSFWFSTAEDGTVLYCDDSAGGPASDSKGIGIYSDVVTFSQSNGFSAEGLEGTESVTDDTWHHAVVTGSADGIKIYVDSILDNETDDTPWSLTTDILSIGDGFTGLIDDIRIYEQVLTADEAGMLYSM